MITIAEHNWIWRITIVGTVWYILILLTKQKKLREIQKQLIFRCKLKKLHQQLRSMCTLLCFMTKWLWLTKLKTSWLFINFSNKVFILYYFSFSLIPYFIDMVATNILISSYLDYCYIQININIHPSLIYSFYNISFCQKSVWQYLCQCLNFSLQQSYCCYTYLFFNLLLSHFWDFLNYFQ